MDRRLGKKFGKNNWQPKGTIAWVISLLTIAEGLAAVGSGLRPEHWLKSMPYGALSRATLISAAAALACGLGIAVFAGFGHGLADIRHDVPRLPSPVKPNRVTWKFKAHRNPRRRAANAITRTAEVLIRILVRLFDMIGSFAVASARITINLLRATSYFLLRIVTSIINKFLKLLILSIRRLVSALHSILWIIWRAVLAVVLWTGIMLLLMGVPIAGLIGSGWLITAAGEQTRRYLVDGSLDALWNFGLLGILTIVLLSASWIILATQNPRASLESAETSASNAGPYAALLTLLGGWLFTIIHAIGLGHIYAHWVTLTLTGLVVLATPFVLKRWRQPEDSQPKAFYHAPWHVAYGSGRGLWLSVAAGTAICAAALTVLGLNGQLFFLNNTPEAGQMMTYSALDAGDCLGNSGLQLGTKTRWPKHFRVVPCQSTHVAEVFGIGSYAKGQVFPGVKTVKSQSNALCRQELRPYDGNSASASVYSITDVVPSLSAWKAGDREIVCIAYKATPGHRTGISLRGSIASNQ